jgi:TPR repeat protein
MPRDSLGAALRRLAAIALIAPLCAGSARAQQPGVDLFSNESRAEQRLNATLRPLTAPLSTRSPLREDAHIDLLPPARLLERARRGDPAAHYQLGLIYLAGDKAPRDLVEAYAHIRLAAEAGHPRAVTLLFSIGARMTAAEHERAGARAAAFRTARQD